MEESIQKIITNLDKLYKDPKSKNFVLHLVRAYLPVNKAQKVFNKPENMKKFKCALTNHKMISVDELFAIMNGEEYKEGFVQDLKFNVGLTEAPENYKPLMVQLAKNRIMGYQGEETSTYMCSEAINGLFNWVSNQLLMGDGKINWTIKQMKTDAFTSKFDGSSDPETKKQVSRIKKISRQPKRAKMTLGDLDVLSDLKKKMDAAAKDENKG